MVLGEPFSHGGYSKHGGSSVVELGFLPLCVPLHSLFLNLASEIKF